MCNFVQSTKGQRLCTVIFDTIVGDCSLTLLKNLSWPLTLFHKFLLYFHTLLLTKPRKTGHGKSALSFDLLPWSGLQIACSTGLLSSNSCFTKFFFLVKGRQHQYKKYWFSALHTYNNSRTTFMYNYIAKVLYNILNCLSFLVAY